jgi:hypothetical protein
MGDPERDDERDEREREREREREPEAEADADADRDRDDAPPRRTRRIVAPIDPAVELLVDNPITKPEDDLFARIPIAARVIELAGAVPVTASRVVALTGGPGAGKSSLLHIVTALLADRDGVAAVSIDGAGYPSAQALANQIVNHLAKFFEAAGVVETGERVRDALSTYGGVVGSIVRFAGVKVDVESAVKRSPESLRAEITENTQQVGKRIVIVIDHVDRMPPAEVAAMIAALRFYAAIPYVAIILGIDRRAVTLRLQRTPGVDPNALERLVQVELALPPVDRVLLARVLAGGIDRVAHRVGRNLDAALALFDPEGGAGLALIESPRDAKRAINAIAAALPLVPATADPFEAVLEVMLRVLVPELDGPRLDARARLDQPGRDALYAELAGRLSGHRRAAAARAALRVLIHPAT